MKKILYTLILILIILILVLITICFVMPKKITSKVEDHFATNNVIKDMEAISFNLDDLLSVSANVPIFMYHWIKDNPGDYPYPENMVKPEELRKQMQYLKDNDYDVIFVSELDELQHYEKPVILTFDDGWQDVYIHAFPLVKELNMKICMYVITDLIGTPGYCTLDQLKEMRDSGLVEIDSHTLSHPRLATLSVSEITKELTESKAYLKENLDIESEVICYPYGSSNNDVMRVASESYNYGLLMDGGVFKYNSDVSNMYAIERIYAMRSMSLNTFINYCKNASVKIN